MSYEYTAPVCLDSAEISMMRRALVAGGYEVSGSDDAGLSIRFAGRLERGGWSEDASVTFGAELFVAVHSATRSQRDQLLRSLERIVGAMGHAIALEDA